LVSQIFEICNPRAGKRRSSQWQANSAHIRQSRPDPGLGLGHFAVKARFWPRNLTPEPESRHPKVQIRNPNPKSRFPKPETRNPKLEHRQEAIIALESREHAASHDPQVRLSCVAFLSFLGWFRFPVFGLQVSNFGFRVSGFGFRVSGFGYPEMF